MPRSDDPLERLRAALDELAADDAADLLAEARIEARARVRKTLTDAMTRSMLERLHDELADPSDEPRPSAEPPVESRPSAGPPTPGELAWYVYGVVPSDTKLNGSLRGVAPDQAVTILDEGEVAAVCSQVPLDQFDEERLREHLADMEWVETTARAHESVLERVRQQVTVIPMRMCTVYRTEGGIREMLSREAGPLQEALDHLDGKAEWAVKVFTELARGDGQNQDADAGAADARGAAYMERKRIERERRQRAMEAAEDAAALVHDRLSALASDSLLIPLQRPEASGHSGDMILNGVYLVPDTAADGFHEEVRGLMSELEPHGIELQPTGPWPAYNFVPGTIGAAW